MSDSRPRLVVNCATGTIGQFEQVALATVAVADRYDVRLVVSHLAAPKRYELRDPGDPYLQYSITFPALFDFAVPEVLKAYYDRERAAANVDLVARRMAVLRRLGLKGAFFGREPAFAPQQVLQDHPHWRGPRVDHPRRSRTPVFALCLHQPEVQALYRDAVTALADRFPDLDTFWWWTNDSGAGFCWYPDLYPGPNGPSACHAEGPLAALVAFHRAVLDGAQAGGATAPISLMAHTRVWNQHAMPPGAYHYPIDPSTVPDQPSDAVRSLRADLSLTYPVRYLWDPLARLEEAGALRAAPPVAVSCWLSDVYHRACPDLGTVRRLFALWRCADQQPAATKRLPDRLALLHEFAVAEFGDVAAPSVVDGWIALHDAFAAQLRNPYPRPIVRYLPTYGPVSHRWLTRPLVALPQRLSPDEEAYYLPHVFAVGDEARRHGLLDVHGYPAASAVEDYRLRSNYFDQMARHFVVASAHFEQAAGLVDARTHPVAQRDLAATARAAQMMACFWRTCRHWLEFAVLCAQGTEQPAEGVAADRALRATESRSERERERLDVYHRRLFAILRAELDNVLALQTLVAQDSPGDERGTVDSAALVHGALPEDEDTFTLAPELQAQLTRKRAIMLAHWSEVTQLVPLEESQYGH